MLSRRLYLYTSARSTNDWVARFMEFTLSQAPGGGQEVIDHNGFVSRLPRIRPKRVRSGAPADFVRLTSGAEQFKVVFRFQTGSSQLDNKALGDLDSLANVLTAPPYDGARSC